MRQTEAAAHQAELDKLRSDMQAEIDAGKAAPPPPAAVPTDMRNVYYATQPVDAGAKISPAFFEKKATPTDILPDAFTDQNDVVGMYAIRKIEKGDPLTPRNVGKTLPFMEQRIPPGMRAVALQIFNADANYTGGFVVDGDRVDLLYTTFSADGSHPLRTELAMQNVDVLFVPGSQIKTDKSDGVNPIPPPGGSIAVMFTVSPEQAQALLFLDQSKVGRFSMILKARTDKTEIKIPAFVGEDYLGNIKKLQTKIDKSNLRVAEVAQQIADEEKKAQAAQGNTNETATPAPPTPSPTP